MISHPSTLARADISTAIKKELGLSYCESAELFNTLLDNIAEALSQGAVVKLAGFGVFSVKHKNQRIGRNPKTGKETPIPERYVVTFRPSPKFNRRVDLGNRVKL